MLQVYTESVPILFVQQHGTDPHGWQGVSVRETETFDIWRRAGVLLLNGGKGEYAKRTQRLRERVRRNAGLSIEHKGKRATLHYGCIKIEAMPSLQYTA